MILELGSCRLRPWTDADLPSLTRHANDREVWINLRDRFPHPYLEEHGRQFLRYVMQQPWPSVWAIEVDGQAVGGIGVEPGTDIARVSAEIGYWLGRAYWGCGIATAAVRAVTDAAFQRFELTRIFALPFAHNRASIRVLEKAGYVLEGRLPHSAIKDGQLRDQLLLGTYRPR